MIQDYRIVDIGIDINKALGNSSYLIESILTFFTKTKKSQLNFLKEPFSND